MLQEFYCGTAGYRSGVVTAAAWVAAVVWVQSLTQEVLYPSGTDKKKKKKKKKKKGGEFPSWCSRKESN